MRRERVDYGLHRRVYKPDWVGFGSDRIVADVWQTSQSVTKIELMQISSPL